jgi:hypothetical protein
MEHRHHHHRAFTLPEALIASAVLAFVVAAVSQAIVAGQMQSYAGLDEHRAIMLGEELMERVLAMDYVDPEGATGLGPDSGESTWADFDNADDFHGYEETPGNLIDPMGVPYGQEFQTYTRSVATEYTTLSITGFSEDLTGLSVTVTVTSEQGQTWMLTRFIPEPAETAEE